MASKRSAPQVHPSRKEQVPQEQHRPKRQKTNPHAVHKTLQTTHPVNQLKSQVRSLRRLLESDRRLPANIRVEKERELQNAQRELEQNDQAKKRNDMIGRYHKIRFFERQKATKRLKKAKKEYEACDAMDHDARASLRSRVADAEVDLNYALYYPLEVAYVSLFPRKKDGEENDEKEVERKGDKEMWLKVRQCMADNKLEALRNGRLDERDKREQEEAVSKQSFKTKNKQKKGENGNKRKAAEVELAEEDGDDSDGGFFE